MSGNFNGEKKKIDLNKLNLSFNLGSKDNSNNIFDTYFKNVEKDIEVEKGLTFSDDIIKFNNDINNFVKYVKQNICDENIGFMFLVREDNVIKYGKKYKGIIVEKIIIDMISNDDLKNIFEILQKEFYSNYDLYFKNDFIYGWQMGMSINDELNIDFESNIVYDNLWFSEEREKYFNSSVRRR